MAGFLPGSQKRAGSAEKIEADRQLMIAFKSTFSTDHGRAVLRNIMEKYFVLAPHNGDPYKEGQRSVVLDIMFRANVNMAEFEKLLRGEI